MLVQLGTAEQSNISPVVLLKMKEGVTLPIPRVDDNRDTLFE